MKITKDYKNTIQAKLYNEGWDGTDKHAEKILKRTIAPTFCLKVYNEFKFDFCPKWFMDTVNYNLQTMKRLV